MVCCLRPLAMVQIPHCEAPVSAGFTMPQMREPCCVWVWERVPFLSFSSSVGVAMKNRSGRSGRMFNSLHSKSFRRSGLARVLRSEPLEKRHMMAGDTYLPYHNDLIPEDTNQDYSVTALDALLVINALNDSTAAALPTTGVGKADGPRVDVTGDNALTPLDALQVINFINGEGEVGDIVGFSYQLTNINGTPLTTTRLP